MTATRPPKYLALRLFHENAQTPEEFFHELTEEEEGLLMFTGNAIRGIQKSDWRWRQLWRWERCPICERWDCPVYLDFRGRTREQARLSLGPVPFTGEE